MHEGAFIFGRGYVLDYRLIVCPNWCRRDELAKQFREVVATLLESTEESPAVEYIEAGDLRGINLIYQSHFAHVDGRPALDVAGRPARVIYGIAYRPRDQPASIEARRTEFLAAAPTLQKRLENFWDKRQAPDIEFDGQGEKSGIEFDKRPKSMIGLAAVSFFACAVVLYQISTIQGLERNQDVLEKRLAEYGHISCGDKKNSGGTAAAPSLATGQPPAPPAQPPAAPKP